MREESLEAAEEAILTFGEILDDETYESFTKGELDQTELKRLYQLAREWSEASKNLLDIIQKLNTCK